MRFLAIFFIIFIVNAAESLSIKNAYEYLMQNNLSLKANVENINKSLKMRDANYMNFVPQIDIVGHYSYIDKAMSLQIPNNIFPMPLPPIPPINLSTNHLAFGMINVIYPIYAGNKRLGALNLADLNIEDSKLLMELNKRDLFEKLVKNYYGLVLNLNLLASLKSSKDGHEAHLNNALKLAQHAQIARLEVLSAQVAFEKAKNQYSSAQDSAQIAALALKSLIGTKNLALDGDNLNINLDSNLDVDFGALKSLQFYKQNALNYPVLKKIQIKQKQADEVSKIELGSFFPTIALNGGYIFKDNAIALNKITPNWHIGISAKFTLLSPSGRIFKYQASKIAQNEAQYAYQNAKEEILLLVETSYKEALSAKNLIASLDSAIDLANENLKLQNQAFNNGMANSTQVSDAQNQLSFAQIEQENAKFKYIMAFAKLCALSNEIDSFFNAIKEGE